MAGILAVIPLLINDGYFGHKAKDDMYNQFDKWIYTIFFAHGDFSYCSPLTGCSEESSSCKINGRVVMINGRVVKTRYLNY